MQTILVASDAPTLRKEVEAVISGPDVEVRAVTSGPEVVAFVADESPDLVIVDMQMGNMGGMAVCLELRLQESYDAIDHIPVLMLLDRRPDVEVRSVTSGPEVVSFAAEESPDLVIVDMQMGNMGGMAVCLELRLQESYDAVDHIPVLMLLDRRPDVFLARRSGAEGWLVKPLDPLRLRRAVTALLNDGTFADESFSPVPVLVSAGPELQAGSEPKP